jgi:hypothetical protein
MPYMVIGVVSRCGFGGRRLLVVPMWRERYGSGVCMMFVRKSNVCRLGGGIEQWMA